ncbi:DUF3558 family protein [Nocardia sp. NPDC059091]|uniref:DUF3558 family protein n=1 Tax=unclassified Nocardia TaxID=2637762 RepID=UPI0036D12DE1
MVACGAAVLLAGCGTTTSVDSSPNPSRFVSATSAAATTRARTDAGSARPQPGPVDDDATTPAATAPPGTSAPVTAAPGGPLATTVSAAGVVWDACSMSETALAAAGLNTASKTRMPTSAPTWQACRWQSADQAFELILTATDETVDDQLTPGHYQDVRRTAYYGRDVIVYRSVQDTNKLGCYVATSAPFGSVVFTVRNVRVQTGDGEPCAEANRLGAALTRSLP